MSLECDFTGIQQSYDLGTIIIIIIIIINKIFKKFKYYLYKNSIVA